MASARLRMLTGKASHEKKEEEVSSSEASSDGVGIPEILDAPVENLDSLTIESLNSSENGDHASGSNEVQDKGRNVPYEHIRSLGQPELPGVRYCPIISLSRFPHQYLCVKQKNADQVLVKYFAHDKFWERTWTVYYIYPSSDLSAKPLLLVLAAEVHRFLQLINADLGLHLLFSEPPNYNGFLIDFEEFSEQPRYLGVSNSRQTFTKLERAIPPPKPIEIDGGSYNTWRERIDMATETTKKPKTSKEKKVKKRIANKQAWCRQLRRVQRCLGLRAASTINLPSAYDKPADWEEEENAAREEKLASEETPEINVDEPAAHPFESNVVFVSVDVETHERVHSQITEIGISTLDTHDLIGIAPGPGGKVWMEKVVARHFRIKEYAHHVNSDFITGCPDRFEAKFGQSEFISLKDAPQVIAACFSPRLSDITSDDGQEVEGQQSGTVRPIVVVGHDVSQDISYLREVGLEVAKLKNLVEVLDTSGLYRALKHETQGCSLGSLCYLVGIDAWNLHNAGNDAAYTLQAMIGVAIAGLAQTKDALRRSRADRIEEAGEEGETIEPIEKDYDEWSKTSDSDDGGGVPVKYVEESEERARDGFSKGLGGGSEAKAKIT